MTKGEKSTNVRPFRNPREYFREKAIIDEKYLQKYILNQEEYLKTGKPSRKTSIQWKKWQSEIEQLDARLPRDPDFPDMAIDITTVLEDEKYLSFLTEEQLLRWPDNEFKREYLRKRELTPDVKKYRRQTTKLWLVFEKKWHPSRAEKSARKKEKLKLKRERKRRELIENREPRFCPICEREIPKEKRSNAKTCGLYACKKALQEGRIPGKTQ